VSQKVRSPLWSFFRQDLDRYREWLAAIPDTKVKTQNNLLGYIRNIYGIALEKKLINEDPFEHVKNFPQSEKFEKDWRFCRAALADAGDPIEPSIGVEFFGSRVDGVP
jgi:hypothetical protein